MNGMEVGKLWELQELQNLLDTQIPALSLAITDVLRNVCIFLCVCVCVSYNEKMLFNIKTCCS